LNPVIAAIDTCKSARGPRSFSIHRREFHPKRARCVAAEGGIALSKGAEEEEEEELDSAETISKISLRGGDAAAAARFNWRELKFSSFFFSFSKRETRRSRRTTPASTPSAAVPP